MDSYQTPSGQTIAVHQGDLTDERTDAVVNAANEELLMGGGVAGAILRRGGDAIQNECDRWTARHGPVPTGQAAVTGAGRLRCRYVIHAAGPIWYGGGRGEDDLLRPAVWSSLRAAHDLGLASVALPAISSGIFGFPKDRAAAILVGTALRFCAEFPGSPLRLVRLVNINAPTTDLLRAALAARTAAG